MPDAGCLDDHPHRHQLCGAYAYRPGLESIDLISVGAARLAYLALLPLAAREPPAVST